jgi:antitoxin component YwqK of YwqJK toxin-antitoxin module
MGELKIETLYGPLTGIETCSYYYDGKVDACSICQPNILETPYGTLVPQYDDIGVRRKNNVSLSFFSSGNLKSISLHEQTAVKTSIGIIPAEYITFYESGEIRRIFPLNGKLSGYWSEEEECELAQNLDFSFPFASFSKKVIGIQFYKNGNIKSITFWPKEKISVITSQGEITARTGISLYENGKLKSLEPNIPTQINTPIGTITAFDFTPLGINGDINSLAFFEDGSIQSILTYSTKVEVTNSNNEIKIYEPSTANLSCSEMEDPVPIKIDFEGDKVIFNSSDKYIISSCKFITSKISRKLTSGCSSCSSCSSFN